ncbi:MAG: ABC transporter substrate-binding protein, partial [Candidatus Binatia bacterium]
AAGRYTLKIFLKAPNPVFPTLLSSIRSFSVVPKGSLEVGMRKPPKFPPGTGPFKFTKWVPGQRIVLDRFDDYWGHKAYLDRVVLKVISNSAVRFTTVRTGEVDLIARAPYEWIKKIVAGEIKGVDVAKGSFGNARNIEFNVAAAPFNNKKMRYAVAHALDRTEILNAAYAGLGTPVEQRFPNDSIWYFKEAAAPSLDLDKARALLKEAGYKGEELDLLLTRGVAGREIEAAVVQAQLKRIGMKVKLIVLERGAALDLRRKGKFTFRFKGGSYYKDPVEAYNEYGCEEDLTKRIQNEAGYCSKEFDALLAKAETEVDPGKRKALVKRLVIKLYTDLPLVGIGVTPRYFAFGDRVRGFTTNQNADFLYWGGGLHYTWLDK